MQETNYKYGAEMNANDDVFCCELRTFLSHYLPQCRLPAADFEARSNAGMKYAKSLFKENQKLTSEADVSRRLSQVVDAILGSFENGGKCLWYSLDQNPTGVSTMLGGNFIISSCLKNHEGEHLGTTNIIVPMEVQLSRNYGGIRQNRLQLASAVVQIMNDDVRRMFIFGITVEEHRMSLWYFSRDHSVKTQSFDFVKSPDTLVSVLISLVFADDRDLGFDPNIALKSSTKRQFIYTVNDQTGPRRFLTTHSISENQAFRHMTRVFRVVELDEQTDLPQQDAKAMVLKDAWLEKGAKTEMEIQRELFADIKKFAENPDWRKHDCVSAFDQEEDVPTMDAFEKLLGGESYKDLFLVIQASSTGESIQQLARSAWRAKSQIFFPNLDSVYADDPFSSTQRQMGPGPSPLGNTKNDPAAQGIKPECRQYNFKQRSFTIFDDECTSLYCLPTIGDVFTVLSDCMTALRFMFCAGWVHRDISCSNVMAIQDLETKRWKLKLADLEYAKKFELTTDTPNCKIGTPFFMSCEILGGSYLGIEVAKPIRVSGRSRRDLIFDPDEDSEHACPIVHNFLHDLEACFWTALWIITCRMNHEPSKTYALPIFQNTSNLELPFSRLIAFKRPIGAKLRDYLSEPLKGLAAYLNLIRHFLYAATQDLGKAKAWSMEAGCRIYSEAHANMASTFRDIVNDLADDKAPWGTVRLQKSTSSSPRPMDPSIDEKSGESIQPQDREQLEDLQDTTKKKLCSGRYAFPSPATTLLRPKALPESDRFGVLRSEGL
ncbi:hypothetical protein EST38_g9838 [Candolleomyces aberdarensis]|uniref:Fungal-type protein kinase domain-containing protein n=1 Tax=Candolleomyces aberdarensis TaxID=2316362 RepID=A0A4Q2D8X2_9AGAR|nr:hypothetical protein EST38_g9838 [Candolleomyces aberdarensis]